jgi:hypothetical protein
MNIRTSLLDGFDNASVNIYFFLTHAGLRMVSVLPILYLNTVTSLPYSCEQYALGVDMSPRLQIQLNNFTN